MNVRIKLFAAARDLAGRDEILVDVTTRATIKDVSQALESATPNLRPLLPHCLWAVDAAYAGKNAVVTEESEIALIPPVSGG
jgi:molybdopterin converting factor small subunit